MPITVQREPLCRTPIPAELAAELSIDPAKAPGILCGLEAEHRGACLVAVETATHVVQLAWWKHNYPPAQPEHLPLPAAAREDPGAGGSGAPWWRQP